MFIIVNAFLVDVKARKEGISRLYEMNAKIELYVCIHDDLCLGLVCIQFVHMQALLCNACRVRELVNQYTQPHRLFIYLK